MTKLFKILALALGFGLLTAGLTTITSTPAPAAGSAPVNIAAVSVPSVPVNGTVSVGNTPSVNVANTPTVTFANGSSVNVSNPLDTQNNSKPLATIETTQPYEDFCSVLSNGTTGINCPLHGIPTGKRLVIQEVDMSIQVNQGLKPVLVGVSTNSPVVSHQFTATLMGDFQGVDYFSMHQETRLYVGTNQTPTCSVGLSGASTVGGVNCFLSGFLVDVP